MDEFETGFEADSETGSETDLETGFQTHQDVPFQVDFEHSGHRPVDDALDRLARLPGTPLAGHADVYDAIHNDLRAILSDQPAGAQGPR